jgi:hypothetical protein
MLLRGLLYLLFFTGTISTASVYVDGYTKADGTYVEGHYRSSPNDTVSDNYSTDGNENPYTGEEGSREVYGGYSSRDSYSDGNNNSLIIAGIVLGVIVITILISIVTKNLFVGYLLFERKTVFWTWFILTIINQVAFFGACLQPYCILASIPHVSTITLLIMYMMYKSAVTTFDPETGYNYFGYNKDGYNKYGNDKFGYDKNGYDNKGFDRDGKDRLGKGSIGRFFAGSEHNEKIAKINEEAIKAKAAEIDADLKAKAGANALIVAEREAELEELLREYDTAEPKKQLGDKQKNMLTLTNSQHLNDYKKVSDKNVDVKNFRLYYKDKPTNLVWYDGKIIFVSKEYFLLKNLANLTAVEKHKCSLFASDVALVDELKGKNIKFVLEPNLRELLSRLEIFGKNMLSDEVSIEFISDQDYSEINEAIYLGDGVWLNA